MTVEDRAPDPREAYSAPEFVALLQKLKDASGLTFRELAQRAESAGDVLPRSTIANMLARASVPREELLAAFVRACGLGPDRVRDWLAVRAELAAHGQRTATGEPPGDAPALTGTLSSEPPAAPLPGPPAPRRRTRALTAAVVAAVVLAAAGVTAALLARGGDQDANDDAAKGGDRANGPVAGPVAGRTVRLRSVHSGLCFSEKRGTDQGWLYQVPCAQETIPSFSLLPLGDDLWRIVTDHPVYKKGCTGVIDGAPDTGAPLQDQECGLRGKAEEFLIQPVGSPAEGYRILPAHTRLCVGTEDRSTARGAKLVQTSCEGPDRGRLFSFDPVASG
ncbi:helix-turn-helix domain-containing protein [Streptomyces sp. NPDC056347]|uniref:helix-turn-helix domain-containing protein n=1 Tax=Streptomyces sp. NPDC056347 TaxID=3345790 RepID=UPI0035DA61B0